LQLTYFAYIAPEDMWNFDSAMQPAAVLPITNSERGDAQAAVAIMRAA
jgi:hypothetical protein